jgi:ABC-2 type transport system permease protein
MLPLLRSELFRLSRRLMPRILLLILVASVLALYLLLWTAVRSGGRGARAQDLEDLKSNLQISAVRDFGLSLVSQVGTILVVILAASVVGTEFGWGTIRTVLPRAKGRLSFLTAKLATLALFVIVVVVLGFLVAFGASALVTAAEGMDGGLGDQFLPHTLASLGRTVYVMLPYLALAFTMALWTRSSAAGIGVGLALLILEGPITAAIGGAGGVFEWIPKLLLGANVQAVMRANVPESSRSFSETTRELLSPWAAAGVLALYTAGSLAFAYLRFRGRDITTG